MKRNLCALGVLCASVVQFLVAVGCGPASGSDPEFWTPLAGGGGDEPDSGQGSQSSAQAASSGAGAGGAGGGGPVSPLGGALAFGFTTVSFGGEYAPRNVGAVWIADGQGAFVKTLEVWAAKRSKHLVKWRAASGNNVVDAVTGATRSSHVAHELLWDGTDTAGQAVPAGAYRIYVEFTEENSAEAGTPDGPWLVIDFVRGPDPLEIAMPDQPAFKAIHLAYKP